MKIPIILLFGFVAQWAQAAPSAFGSQKCGKQVIKNNTNSDVLNDTEICGEFYVLPPLSGTTEIKSFVPNANLGMCGSMKNIFSEIDRVAAISSRVTDRIDELIEETDQILEEKEAAEKEFIETSDSEVFKKIAELSRQITSLNSAITLITDDLGGCTSNCRELRSEYKQLSRQRQEKQKLLARLEAKNYHLILRRDELKAEINALEKRSDDLFKKIDDLGKVISSINDRLKDNYKYYAQLEGGTALLSYNSGWEQNLSTLRQQNPGKVFHPSKTKNARLFVGITGGSDRETYLNSLPMVLDYTIAGRAYTPYGQGNESVMPSLSSKIAGSIRFSMAGGCPYYYKNYISAPNLEVNTDLSTLPKYGISASYEYPSSFALEVEASYNLYKMYERIEKSSSKGGFFSRKTYHSLVENRVDKDTFKIDWKVEDPGLDLTFEKRRDIERALKEDLVQRVLRMSAQPAKPDTINVRQHAIMPATNGVQTFAIGLRKMCWGSSFWCKGGYYVLRGIGSTFGRTSASSYYRNTHNSTATEIWSSQINTWKSGIIGFPPE